MLNMHLCIVWYGVDHVKYRTKPKYNFQKIYYMLIQGMTPAQKFYWSIGKSLCTISCRFTLIKCSSLSDLTSCVWWIFFVVLFIMSNVTWWFVFSISSLYNFVTDKKKMSLDDFLTDDIFSHGFYPDKDFFCFLICLQDGHLRIFEWPNMRILLDEPRVMSFRDLDFRLA